MRRTAPVLLALLALAASAAPARASAWTLPQPLAQQVEVPPALTAVPGDGFATAWLTIEAGPAGTGVGALQAAVRPAAAPFGAPLRMSPPGDDVRAFSLAAARGGAVAAWRAGRSANGRLRVAFAPPGGPFAAPRTIPGAGTLPQSLRVTGESADRSRPAAAVGDDGTAVVAWLARAPRGCGFEVRAAVGGATGDWRVARVSPRCAHAWAPAVAVDEDGEGAIAWRSGRACAVDSFCRQRLLAAAVRGARIGRAAVLAPAVAAAGPAVAAAAGRGVVAWRSSRGRLPYGASGTRGRVAAATFADGAFARRQDVSRSDRIWGAPRAAAGGGALAVAWQTGLPVTGRSPVQAALSARAGEAFGPPESLPQQGVVDGRAENLQLALGDAGDAIALWCNSSLRLVAAVRARSARAFAEPAPVAGPTAQLSGGPCPGGRGRARLAVGAGGAAVAVWTTLQRELVVTDRPPPLTG